MATIAKSIGSENPKLLHCSLKLCHRHRRHRQQIKMKVLEAQSAVLSNYEVQQHLKEQRTRYRKKQHRGPSNLENVVKEVR